MTVWFDAEVGVWTNGTNCRAPKMDLGNCVISIFDKVAFHSGGEKMNYLILSKAIIYPY